MEVLCQVMLKVVLFVCLRFFVPLENFSLTIDGEGLQMLTYARHSWPLSSGGSLACHTYCDTGHPFIMVIFEDPWQSAFGSGVDITCFYDLGLMRVCCELCEDLFMVCENETFKWNHISPMKNWPKVCRGWPSNTHPSACEATALTHCATAAVETGPVVLEKKIGKFRQCIFSISLLSHLGKRRSNSFDSTSIHLCQIWFNLALRF